MSKHLSSIKLGLLVTAAACSAKPGADAGQQAAAATPASAAAPVVDVIGMDYAFQAPDTMPAGVVTIRFHNNGKELHHVQVARLDSGKTVADLHGPMAAPPAWLVPIGGPNAPPPGGVFEAQVDLTPGNYVLMCLIPSAVDGQPHLMKGMLKPFTVTGSGAAVATYPAADVTIRLTNYDFVMSQPLTAGHHVIQIETDSTQLHEMLIARLNDGKTALELAQWAEKPNGPPPGMPLGGVTGIAPGQKNTIEVDLTPGEYALICFMPDAKDGKPHYEHGMVKQVKIS